MKKTIFIGIIVALAALVVAGIGLTAPNAGSRTTGMIIQNIDPVAGIATVNIGYYAQDGTIKTSQSITVNQYAAKGINAAQVNGLGSSFVGSAVVSSDKLVGVIGNLTDDDDTAMFSGFTDGANKVYLPALYKVGGNVTWNSEIWIQSTESVPSGAKATIKFMDRQGNQTGTTKEITLITYATVKVSPADYNDIPAGWAGGAVVESSYKIAALGLVTNGPIVEMYNAFGGGDTTVYAPALYRRAGGWTSGIMVQNLGTVPISVTVDFYDRLGNKTTTYTYPGSFVPNGVKAVNTVNVGGLSDGWSGTAVVKSSVAGAPIIAIIDVTNMGAGIGSMYNAGLASDASTEVYVPAQYKYLGDWTAGIIAMNIGSEPANVTFRYYDRLTQAETTFVTKTIGVNIAFAQNTVPIINLGAAWAGAAKVVSSQPVIVVANTTGIDGRSTAGKGAMYNCFPKK